MKKREEALSAGALGGFFVRNCGIGEQIEHFLICGDWVSLISDFDKSRCRHAGFAARAKVGCGGLFGLLKERL